MNILDELMEEVAKLKEGNNLLEQVWAAHGAYGTGGPTGDGIIPDELRYKINHFFGFDDSE
jgi:hypothetical protein